MDSEPRYGDSDNTLLFRIATAINAGGGGGGGGVSTFNTRVGAVTLTSGDVTSALGFTPANGALYVLKAGDTMSGRLDIIPSLANTGNLFLSGGSITGADATSFLNLTGTWNTSGAPSAIAVNITNTASNSLARLFKLQLASVTRFDVSQFGNVEISPQYGAGSGVGLTINNGVTSVAGAAARGLFVTGTWDTSGVCNAIRADITNTQSDPTSTLLLLQVAGTPVFSVDLSGNVTYTGALNGALPANPTFTSVTTDGVAIAGGGPELNLGGLLGAGGSFEVRNDGSATFAANGFPFNIDQNGSVGFFGAGVQTQQTSGANLTNNVTAGGTDNTIANYTDLTTYATDAAAIRNNLYQLARKLKQINDGLRLYGLYT